MVDQVTRAALKLFVQGGFRNPRVERVVLDMVDTLALRRENDVLETEEGSGITSATGGFYHSSVIETVGGIITTRILIDITGLDSGDDTDIIGDALAANCHLGQITAAENGTIVAGSMKCLETPATGEPDIDLYSAVESTGVQDAVVTGLDETILLATAVDWTGILASKGLTALPAADEYLYLATSGGATAATYTAGKILIELLGFRA